MEVTDVKVVYYYAVREELREVDTKRSQGGRRQRQAKPRSRHQAKPRRPTPAPSECYMGSRAKRLLSYQTSKIWRTMQQNDACMFQEQNTFTAFARSKFVQHRHLRAVSIIMRNANNTTHHWQRLNDNTAFAANTQFKTNRKSAETTAEQYANKWRYKQTNAQQSPQTTKTNAAHLQMP